MKVFLKYFVHGCSLTSVKEKQNFMEYYFRKACAKNIKKQERLIFRLRALFLLKNILCLYFSPAAKVWSRKSTFYSFCFVKVLQDRKCEEKKAVS